MDEHLVIEHRIPMAAVVRGRDRKHHEVLVSSPDLRGGLDWFAEGPWIRTAPGYDTAPEMTR